MKRIIPIGQGQQGNGIDEYRRLGHRSFPGRGPAVRVIIMLCGKIENTRSDSLIRQAVHRV